ncbi:hypothetical protein NFHSH190041_20510 [Shewanella sp. NFH-SH190041]|uniref:hypothetical protein n=1 Tax=Shewanella sp. NFH-SH190041 TaxID=2950245 RepID=UPI0021C3BA24|nr:hypothetical protein [Shewanella sp. NFH-SH190041]BDM64599.1 hypothetical protein NFHSH190041_20510 [Shewanella sp. NFH-SH190041]
MINLVLLPLITATGAVTANLTELVRGESGQWHPKLTIGTLTFYLAVTAYILVWFALLVSGIEVTSDEGVTFGVEYMLLFLAGLIIYTMAKASRFVSENVQLWIYRLALPLVAVTSFMAFKFG